MESQDQKNLVVAIILSTLIMIGYWFFIGRPMQEAARQQAKDTQQQTIAKAQDPEAFTLQPRTEALATGQRITINTASLSGSLLLDGFRLDDIELKNYKQTIEPNSPNVILLTPEKAEHASYVFDNWVLQDGGNGANNIWTVKSGGVLTETSPVILIYEGQGFSVERTVTIDERYLITLTDTVTNVSGADLNIIRKGAARQHSLPPDLTNFFILQEGPISIVDGELHDMKYKKLSKKRSASYAGESGWAGLTDKYWLSAAIAPQGKPMTAEFNYRMLNDREVYEASYALDPITLSPGTTINSIGYMFAGAKDQKVLQTYQNETGISELERAIDWGMLRILTRPMSWALSTMGQFFGNYGLGIMALTLFIKLLIFPLANKQYASQAKMKKVQPKMKKLQELYKDDRMKLQQEMMAMYRKEGVNPMAGCLPIIPTMFVFFALYKTVLISVELRHAPFFGYIQDLSAPEPLSILNLFGLLPWGPEPIAALSILAIGPLAMLYGITMSMMYTLTPQQGTDPLQQKVFKFMPWIFMFILAPFAAGLLIYWVWSNILSFAQQYYITRKYKVHTPFDSFFDKLLGKADKGKETAKDKE